LLSTKYLKSGGAKIINLFSKITFFTVLILILSFAPQVRANGQQNDPRPPLNPEERMREKQMTRETAPTDRDFYDEITRSQHYREGDIEATFGAFKTPDGQTSYEFLRNAVPDLSGKTVVDLASGSGPVSKVCLQDVGPDGKVIAVDFNEKELELARQTLRGENVTFLNESAQKLSLPSSSVDAVFCHLAVMLFRPLPPVVTEMARILRPGGVFSAVVLPNDLLHTDSPIFNEYLEVAAQYDSAELQLNKWGWGDLGADNIEGFKTSFNEEIGFESDISVDNFTLELEDTPENLLIKLRAFFQTSYLLHDEMQRKEYEGRLLEVLKKYQAGNGKAKFQMPFVRVTVRKKIDIASPRVGRVQEGVRRAIQREHIDRIKGEPTVTEDSTMTPREGKTQRWLKEIGGRISSRLRKGH